MPPVIAAVAAAAQAIALATNISVGEALAECTEFAPRLDSEEKMLKIEGAICKSGVPSTHLMSEDAQGRQKNIGTVAFFRKDEMDFDLTGVPLFSPAPGVQIGTITRSWWDAEDFLRIEGEIRDSQEARYWMGANGDKWRKCGLCPFLTLPSTAPGVISFNAAIERVNITLPMLGGFGESWIRFADPSIKYVAPSVEPGKVCAAPIFFGRGF